VLLRGAPGEGRSLESWQPAPVISAIAASLLLAIVGLGGWIFALHRESHRLTAMLTAQDTVVAETRRELSEAARRAGQDATQIAGLRRDLDRFTQPQLNAPVKDVDPGDLVRGSTAHGLQTVAIPATANMFTLVLNISSRPSFPDYSLEILNQQSETVWTGRGLQKTPFDTFNVALPRKLMPMGTYRIKLYGLRGDRRELIEDYRVRIQYQ
jgi:hypothetical protein